MRKYVSLFAVLLALGMLVGCGSESTGELDPSKLEAELNADVGHSVEECKDRCQQWYIWDVMMCMQITDPKERDRCSQRAMQRYSQCIVFCSIHN